jgi:hypothetical protein
MRKQVYYPPAIDLSIDELKRLSKAKGRELKQHKELIQDGLERIKNYMIW